MRKKCIVTIMLFFCVIGVLVAFFLYKKKENSSELMEALNNIKGNTRVISTEEYEFYRYFVERDLPRDVSSEEVQNKTIQYTEYVNAVFCLGNKLGLCEPYSFEVLCFRLEQENQNRELRQGEAIYGLEQFTLETYFQYVLGNLETALHQYMETNADEKIMKMAEEYYISHKELFQYRAEVIYELRIADEKETVLADSASLNMLGKSDMGLADFLYSAEVGEEYQDIKDGNLREIVIKDIIYGKDGFEINKEIILHKFIRDEFYGTMIEQIAMNNPIEFEIN